MPARRFTLIFDDDDSTFYCAAWSSRLERDRAAADLVDARPLAPADPPDEEQRPRGRPSFAAMIAAAVTALETKLAGCESVSARARLVLRHLAQLLPPEEMPSTSTVRALLAERSAVAEKSAEKSANKSKRARIRAPGGVWNAIRKSRR